ncbi:MAG: PLP-dependent lyase/thiolase [Verrucomicrobiota bacterium]
MRVVRLIAVSLISLLFFPSQAISNKEYTLKKIIAHRPNIVWINPSVQKIDPILSEKIMEIYSALNVHKVIVNTPLKRLDRISKLTGKEVYLKDDALQSSGSFKIRGVACEVYITISAYLERLAELLDAGATVPEKPFYIVTQSDGNHGIAMIEAVAIVVHNQAILRPSLARHIKRIEPVVFTIDAIPKAKKTRMYEALRHYRSVAGDDRKGDIVIHGNYLDAKNARNTFIAKHMDRAAYMQHGGYNIMAGHASIGIEIDQQLTENGIGYDKKVAFFVPVGAGGPTGMLAGIKVKRPGAIGVLVQTKPYSALIKSLIDGKLVSNSPDPEPTFVLNGKSYVFEDGIAVDAPEAGAIDMARQIADLGLVVDPKANIFFAAPLLHNDLSKYPDIFIGGTTSAALEALLEYPNIPQIKNAEVIVILGTERNIDKEISKFIKDLARGNIPD